MVDATQTEIGLSFGLSIAIQQNLFLTALSGK
jgi:hypothetical protein